MALQLLVLVLVAMALPAHAGRKDVLRSVGRGPAANAGEIPELAELLRRTGWEPTPELSGAFRAGFVFRPSEQGHRLQVEDCFAVAPTVSTYTSAEVVTQLQAGVSVNLGLGRASASGGLVKRLKFGAPEHHALPELKLVPTGECRQMLDWFADQGADLDELYVVQEVLTARIAEQTCGRIDAGGSFVGLGAAETELAVACAQESLEPVAIAYRTVPVSQLPTSVPKPRAERPAPVTAAPVSSRPAPAPPRPVTPAPTGLEAELAAHLPLYFQSGQAELDDRSSEDLDAIAVLLESQGPVHVRIEVHTDAQGADTWNLSLSQQRADAVRKALTGRGVPIEWLEAVGYGETRPIASNQTAEGRARNRRVELRVLPTG